MGLAIERRLIRALEGSWLKFWSGSRSDLAAKNRGTSVDSAPCFSCFSGGGTARQAKSARFRSRYSRTPRSVASEMALS